LTRYFDHIQACPAVRKSADAISPPLPVVSFDIENAPRIERKNEPTKKREKQAKPTQPDEVKASASTVSDSTKQGEGKSKKEKKTDKAPAGDAGRKKAGGAGKESVSAEDAEEPVPSMIDLRVGHIVDSASLFSSCM
jgi:aminoacyl tRNA synthase complex-interacting multifunctional protein 1